ncbi:lysophospholipid acyltransferase family protein [Parvularcula marina]|uniref:lysophospholipid acyltransferase family protein n=1 Tax=Parvularcula marina TaxID=2292771 RepID=UPI003514683B
MARKTSQNSFLARLGPFLLAGYIRLIHRTLRWRYDGLEQYKALLDSGEPYICAAWHSRLLMLPALAPLQKAPATVLVSEHRDGEVIARIVRQFGLEVRRGSAADPRKPEKNKGGAAALRALKKAMDEGYTVGITPDGPRGPRQRAHAGIAQLSRLTGAPIVPIAYSVKRGKTFSSWDRFLLPFPLPFSRGIFVFGDPILPVEGRNTDPEWLRQRVEDELNRITEKADREMGREPLDPAPIGHLKEAKAR